MKFVARFLLAAALVFVGYMALIGYTHVVYERGWEDRGDYDDALNEDWPEPQPEIDT